MSQSRHKVARKLTTRNVAIGRTRRAVCYSSAAPAPPLPFASTNLTRDALQRGHRYGSVRLSTTNSQVRQSQLVNSSLCRVSSAPVLAVIALVSGASLGLPAV